jgi:hypothetical protein
VPNAIIAIKSESARLPSEAVGIGAEHDAADRPHHESHREGRVGQHQRQLAAGREEHCGDDAGEIAVGDEIEPFEPVAEHRCQHHPPPHAVFR